MKLLGQDTSPHYSGRRKRYDSVSIEGRAWRGEGIPFGMSDCKSQMANLESEICDLKFLAVARTRAAAHCLRSEGSLLDHCHQCTILASFSPTLLSHFAFDE